MYAVLSGFFFGSGPVWMLHGFIKGDRLTVVIAFLVFIAGVIGTVDMCRCKSAKRD